jgi:hypothetical protein
MIHLVTFIESSGFLSQYFTIRLLRRSPDKKRQLTLGRRGSAVQSVSLGSAAESLSMGAPVWLSA